ncbi:Nif3-like dinuclear metal center hexameric protein [Terrilactibacillus sp. BCM23-1]|uniref:GTP cyclohydrolase 1 type 2 homolog n=1 Tax=Terrilactibacillus tamarindi TaxID=2599694 RepID=A0A6N8CSK2_9BACI|nr:Nif3-like dinuclear metal center hexameric protein [Terrilactibacillus tamarindi]MTT33162.1 Nif3-like dinuclear metal center hexameric protein [Terrilactibacillus tamarindi]
MTNWIHGQRLIQLLEEWVPKKLAFENDKIGLQIGTLNKKVKKVMITLDVLENVVQEAIDRKVDLIIAHHPVIYRPLKTIHPDEGQGKIVSACIQNNIAVYVAHTNLDMAPGGVNDMLSQELELQDIDILKPTIHESLYKLSVYVPESHAHIVREAITGAGAGHIGNYSSCTFSSQGMGTFLPGEATHPFIGKSGMLEEVNEFKIETIVPKSLLNKVVRTMVRSHPYEEVAYDIYPLENKGQPYGLGRIGKLKNTMSLEELALHVKHLYEMDGIRVIGDRKQRVNKVAISGGDGNSLIPYAKYKGADVLISGDIYYHTAHDALLHGLTVIDAGHYIEKIMKKYVCEFLKHVIDQESHQTEVIVSESNTNPFTYM